MEDLSCCHIDITLFTRSISPTSLILSIHLASHGAVHDVGWTAHQADRESSAGLAKGFSRPTRPRCYVHSVFWLTYLLGSRALGCALPSFKAISGRTGLPSRCDLSGPSLRCPGSASCAGEGEPACRWSCAEILRTLTPSGRTVPSNGTTNEFVLPLNH